MSLSTLLIGDGYFPVEVPPAFSTHSFASMVDVIGSDLASFVRNSSRCLYHSYPRVQHSRRLLGIPNPLHQLRLSRVIEEFWPDLEKHMAQSTLSLTTLKISERPPRALTKNFGFDALDTERVLRSSAARYLLKADLSRFYHTLYTHSIPWAIHTKEVSKEKRRDRTLFGNLIDEAVRNTQDQQTMGIPVGPDSSDLISEILGVALDLHL